MLLLFWHQQSGELQGTGSGSGTTSSLLAIQRAITGDSEGLCSDTSLLSNVTGLQAVVSGISTEISQFTVDHVFGGLGNGIGSSEAISALVRGYFAESIGQAADSAILGRLTDLLPDESDGSSDAFVILGLQKFFLGSTYGLADVDSQLGNKTGFTSQVMGLGTTSLPFITRAIGLSGDTTGVVQSYGQILLIATFGTNSYGRADDLGKLGRITNVIPNESEGTSGNFSVVRLRRPFSGFANGMTDLTSKVSNRPGLSGVTTGLGTSIQPTVFRIRGMTGHSLGLVQADSGIILLSTFAGQSVGQGINEADLGRILLLIGDSIGLSETLILRFGQPFPVHISISAMKATDMSIDALEVA